MLYKNGTVTKEVQVFEKRYFTSKKLQEKMASKQESKFKKLEKVSETAALSLPTMELSILYAKLVVILFILIDNT